MDPRIEIILFLLFCSAIVLVAWGIINNSKRFPRLMKFFSYKTEEDLLDSKETSNEGEKGGTNGEKNDAE